MTHKEYNGWTNYETWNVKLWLDNSEGDQAYWTEQAADAWEHAESDLPFTRAEMATQDLADRLKDSFEEREAEILGAANLTASVWADLLGAALSEVNWHEIAQHYIDELDKEASEPA